MKKSTTITITGEDNIARMLVEQLIHMPDGSDRHCGFRIRPHHSFVTFHTKHEAVEAMWDAYCKLFKTEANRVLGHIRYHKGSSITLFASKATIN